MNNQTPIGTIIIYTGAKIPNGWISCDGRRVSINDLNRMTRSAAVANNSYKKLQSVLGATCQLPNLQDKFIKGKQNIHQENQTGEPSKHKHIAKDLEMQVVISGGGEHSHSFPSHWYKRSFTNPAGFTTERKGIDTGGGDVKYQKLQSSSGHDHTAKVKISNLESGLSNDANRPAWYRGHFIMRVLL